MMNIASLKPGCWSLMFMVSFAVAATRDTAAAAEDSAALAELRAERAKLAGQQRRLIMNNDGCDCLYFPLDREVTADNFLGLRTTGLAGTHVDSIAYCSISSGFGQFTHDTKTGAVLEHSASAFGIAPDKRNIARNLIDSGTDPLRLVTGFAHRHEMECFWSMRMNDTHDVQHRPDKPYFLFPKLKEQHPEWLVGNHVDRTPHGRWSSVDYAVPEVRELAFQYLEEVCRNYDIDGVELDYFRHLCYFREVANGGRATAEHRDLMTGLMRRIRRLTEETGLKRGRPILVSMRVPDSPDYCRDMGLDVEQWLEEGLVDILITSGYFRLHPWETSVALGHKYGVQVFPCLTDPRVRGETRFRRQSIEAYRARAANAWAAGADGLQLFNLFDPDSPVWRECGDPEALRFSGKLYFVTPVDGSANRWLAEGESYRTLPLLSPRNPAALKAGRAFSTAIALAEAPAAARQAGYRPQARLHLDSPGLADPRLLDVRFNGVQLADGQAVEGWLDYPLPISALKRGSNAIEIRLRPRPVPVENEWSLVFDGKGTPSHPWRRDPASERTLEKVVDGALLIADRGEESGDYRYYRYPWGADPDRECVIEARVKVGKGSSYLIFSNGRSAERLRLSPGEIGLHHNRKLTWKMNTTDDFHHYRLVLQGDDLRVHVDGELRIDAKGKFAPRTGYRNEVAFGAANSPQMGEAFWDEVKVRAARSTQPLQDIVISTTYAKQQSSTK